MKWLNKFLVSKLKQGLEEDREAQIYGSQKMGTALAIDRGSVEGQDRISFELSTAVGGRILSVRRYDERKDRNESQTYVIPNGEDVGERVAKIINLELFRG